MTIDPIVERERLVQLRLRALTFIASMAGSVALMLSFVDLETWDWTNVHSVHDAWDWTHRAWMFAALLPAAWVLRAGTKKVVLLWAAWFVAVSVALELLTRRDDLGWRMTSPGWVGGCLAALVIVVAVIVLFVLPIVRLRTPEPPGLPAARIHRD